MRFGAQEIVIIIFSALVTMLLYSIFPLLFALIRKQQITTGKYRLLCYVINATIPLMSTVLRLRTTGEIRLNLIPYFLYNELAIWIGSSILKSKKVIVEEPIKAKKMPETQTEIASSAEKRFVCNNCGKLSTGWYQTCPSCGAVGKMEKASSARIKAIENAENGESGIIADGGWRCTKCGKVHFAYESSCSCGTSRFGVEPKEQPARIELPSVQDQKPNAAGTVSTQKVDNRIVFICPDCDSTGLDVDIVVEKKCPKCGAIMIKTGIKSHSWNEMSDSQKEIILKQRQVDKPKEALQESTVENTLIIPSVSSNIAEEIIVKEAEVTAEAEGVNESDREKPISVEKTCQKCGAVLPPDAKFCAMCGEKVEIPKPKPRFCRFCGSKAVEGSLFCHNCGKKLLED